MAILRIKGLDLKKLETSIRLDFTKALRSKKLQDEIGDAIVDQIQKEPKPVRSAATKAWRKYLEQNNTTDPAYRRGKINITFTGALLADLKDSIVTDFNKGLVSFVMRHSSKTHAKYLKPDGGKLKGKSQSFKDISGHIIKLGYNYLKFSATSKKRVVAILKKELKKRLK